MESKFAPYAPPATVLAVIRHHRKRDVPERISTATLQQIGVTESLIPRTVAALKFLGLVQDDLTTTEKFRSLRYAKDDDYEDTLGRILDDVYEDVLKVIELPTATEQEIENAFIPFSPGGQRQRMITLFLALANEAGWSAAVQAKPITPRLSSRKPEKVPANHTPRKASTTIDQTTVAPGATPYVPRVEGTIAFGVTETDLAGLADEDFDAVWSALGKLARSRAEAARRASAAANPPNAGEE
jgi:hypothetical protein